MPVAQTLPSFSSVHGPSESITVSCVDNARALTAALSTPRRRYVAQRSTSALSASAVKSTHVLPFLPRFLESVRRVEAALSQGGPGPRNSPGRGAGLATLSGVRGGPPRPSPFGAAPGAEPGAAAAGQAAAL